MVLTVEPGLYIAPDADVPEQYRGSVFVLKMTLSSPKPVTKKPDRQRGEKRR